MPTAPKASAVERLVVEDLAADLLEREAHLVAVRREYALQHDMVVSLLALVREQTAQIALLRRTVAQLRGMPVD